MRTDLEKREDRNLQQEQRPQILPAYDVWEEGGRITLQVEMPGLERENVDITVENNELTIHGRRPDWNVEGKFLIRERRFGDFRRTFTLDETVDTDSIDAHMNNGVLTLTLKVKEAAKPRKIQVKGG